MDFTLMFVVLLVCLAFGAIMLTVSMGPPTKNKKEESRIHLALRSAFAALDESIHPIERAKAAL